MLYAKYLPNWPSGTGEEVVCMVFTIYGHDCDEAHKNTLE